MCYLNLAIIVNWLQFRTNYFQQNASLFLKLCGAENRVFRRSLSNMPCQFFRCWRWYIIIMWYQAMSVEWWRQPQVRERERDGEKKKLSEYMQNVVFRKFHHPHPIYQFDNESLCVFARCWLPLVKRFRLLHARQPSLFSHIKANRRAHEHFAPTTPSQQSANVAAVRAAKWTRISVCLSNTQAQQRWMWHKFVCNFCYNIFFVVRFVVVTFSV